MKILYLQNIRMPTEKAHGIQIMETCAALASAGHEVTLAISSWQSSGGDDIFAYYGLPKRFSIVRIPGIALPSWGMLGFLIGSSIFALSVRCKLGLGSYDVVFTRDAFLTRPGFFYEMHDARKGSIQKCALKRAAGVICITEGLAEYCEKAGLKADKILVAPDAVDLNEFSVAESKKACREKLDLPLDGKIVLYAGHLYVWKGVDVLAKAAALLPDNARVIFVGGIDHDIRAFRERFANGENEIAAKIVVAGRRPHELIPYYLKAADVLVLPNSARRDISRLYTSPLKLFEYMASGTPIVASDLPSIREILNENNSVLCAPDNPVVLAATISKILNDGGLSAKISVQALSDVKEHTWDKRAAAIVDFIRPILVAKDATKDRDFYNKESAGYSSKRYPERASDYIQFFFKKRLSLTLKVLSRAFNDKTSLSLLEIGCADGVVMREISKKVPRVFSEMTGIDTAEEMIKKAKAMDSQFLKTRYFVRGQEPAGARFDAIIEIGVANYTDFDAELRYAADHLKSGGKYILSIAGNGSLNARLGGGVGYANFLSYGEYEDKIRGLFSLEMSLPVGLRVPLIWRTPALARFVQPILENTFLHIAPGLFHEKVYLLKKL